jgi:H+/gluconate symporter-like permease
MVTDLNNESSNATINISIVEYQEPKTSEKAEFDLGLVIGAGVLIIIIIIIIILIFFQIKHNKEKTEPEPKKSSKKEIKVVKSKKLTHPKKEKPEKVDEGAIVEE